METAARMSGTGLTRSVLWKKAGACNRIVCQSTVAPFRTCHPVFALTCSFLLEKQHLPPGKRVLSPSRPHFCLEPSFPARSLQLACLLFLSASEKLPSALPFRSAASSSPFQLLPSTSLYFGTSLDLSRRALKLPWICLPILLPRRPGPLLDHQTSHYPLHIGDLGTIPPSQLVSFLQPERLLLAAMAPKNQIAK